MRRAGQPARWLAASVLAAGLACGAGEPEPGGRALVVGIDGATLRLLGPWLRDGSLPALAGIARAGVVGPLRSELPLLSPRLWTSIATGRPPSVHGVEGWVRRDADGGLRLYGSSDRRVPALWNILSAAGRRVAVVNWLETHPPERLRGVMISDHAVPGALDARLELAGAFAARQFPDARFPVRAPSPRAPLAEPVAWEARLPELARAVEPLTGVGDPFQDPEAFPDAEARRTLAGVYRSDELVARVALAVDAELRPELLLVYLPGIDRISHLLWAGVEDPARYPEAERPAPEQREAWRRALHAYYRFSDALLARLLEGFGAQDLVLVLSDHGFEAGGRGGLPGAHDSARALDGVLLARGRGVRRGARVEGATLYDVVPSCLLWFGLPLARDMPGRPLPFLELPAAGAVASYDDTPVDRVAEAPSGAEEAILEHLRAVGYVD